MSHGGDYVREREETPEPGSGPRTVPIADQCLWPDGTKAEPPKVDKTNPKDLIGALKPQLHLNPGAALIHMAKAFEFGAFGTDINGVQVRPKGYGPYNWRENSVRATVYLSALGRHLVRVTDGGNVACVADDSKVMDLAHIMACCAILIDAHEGGNLINDLPLPGPAGAVLDRLTLKKAT